MSGEDTAIVPRRDGWRAPAGELAEPAITKRAILELSALHLVSATISVLTMSLPGAARSVVDLLTAQYAVRFPADPQPTFGLIGPSALDDTLNDRVTVFVYRVEQDATRRHHELPPVQHNGTLQRRFSLMVDVRFLLTAWMTDPEGELSVLARCMEILDEHPVLSGPLLAAAYRWDPEAALRVSLDHLPMEDSLRLWDALSPSFRLSIPYVIRTVRLGPAVVTEGPPVGVAARVHASGSAP